RPRPRSLPNCCTSNVNPPSPLRGNDQRWERFCLRGNDRKRGELRTRRPRAGGGPCSVSKNGFPPSRERPEVGAVPAFAGTTKGGGGFPPARERPGAGA